VVAGGFVLEGVAVGLEAFRCFVVVGAGIEQAHWDGLCRGCASGGVAGSGAVLVDTDGYRAVPVGGWQMGLHPVDDTCIAACVRPCDCAADADWLCCFASQRTAQHAQAEQADEAASLTCTRLAA